MTVMSYVESQWDAGGLLGQFHPGPPAAPVSHCPVDANGVPAEWVEATVATTGQPTLVYFPGHGQGRDSLALGRPLAARLAVGTGARILSVGWRPAPGCSASAAVEDGVGAFSWLLDEGCDLETTAFVGDTRDGARAVSVLLALRERGLPLPAAGVLRSNAAERDADRQDTLLADADILISGVCTPAYIFRQRPGLPRQRPL
jgi:acetyl esterase/lipase